MDAPPPPDGRVVVADLVAIAAGRLAIVIADRAAPFGPVIEAAREAFGPSLLELRRPSGLEHLPDRVGVVVVCRDHPDRFRGLPERLRRRWPLAELLFVDGPWGASAGHSRRDVPPAMRADADEAIERLYAIAEGDPPQAWPWTFTQTDVVLATS